MSIFKNPMETTTAYVETINYEGIAKVMAELVELYKVCENKELLDKILERYAIGTSNPTGVFTNLKP